jgi:hypothetical protein
VDGVHDLGVVDSAEVHRRDRKVGMPELPLDDEQRHSLARHLNGVRVSELMWREASSYPDSGGGLPRRPGQEPSLSIVRVAEDGSVPPAAGVIVSPEGSLAGLRTVKTPCAAVVWTSASPAIALVPVARPVTV